MFVLTEPWKLPSASDDDAGLPSFKRRTILVGSNVLDNKYELHKRYPQVTTRFLPWTDQEIQQMVQDGARAEQPTS